MQQILGYIGLWREENRHPKKALIEYQDYLSNAKMHDRAIALLRKGLEINSLTAEFKNHLRIRLATQLLIGGNAFEAGVILSEAFSNIPEPHFTAASQQKENGTTMSLPPSDCARF